MPTSIEAIDVSIAELTAEWERDQQHVGFTRELAQLWERRFCIKRDQESLDGALYYYLHLNQILCGDGGVTTKVKFLQHERIRLQIAGIEFWLSHGGSLHEQAGAYRDLLEELKAAFAKAAVPNMPVEHPAKLFVDIADDRNSPPAAGLGAFSAN